MKNTTVLPGTAGQHAVHFYSDESRLCISVADFLAYGLAVDQPLVIMWNDLARTHSFSLLCGYAMGNFYKETGRDEVCSLHTQVHQ